MNSDQDPRQLDEETITALLYEAWAEDEPDTPHLTHEEIEAFLKAECNIEARARVEEHLSACALCLTTFDHIYKAIRASRESFAQILQNLRDEDDLMKRHDAVLIVQKKAERQEVIPEEVIAEIVHRVDADRSRMVQDVAAVTLGTIGQGAATSAAVSALLKRSASTDALVRRSCALALIKLQPYLSSQDAPRAATGIKRMAADPEWLVQSAFAGKPEIADIPMGEGSSLDEKLLNPASTASQSDRGSGSPDSEVPWSAGLGIGIHCPIRTELRKVLDLAKVQKAHQVLPRPPESPTGPKASRTAPQLRVGLSKAPEGEIVLLGAGEIGDLSWSLCYQKIKKTGSTALITLHVETRYDTEDEARKERKKALIGKTLLFDIQLGANSEVLKVVLDLRGSGLIEGEGIIKIESPDLSDSDLTERDA